MLDPQAIRAVVFAGGGCRCFWQAGLWEEAGHALRPDAVASVSAGAAFACAALGGRTRAVLDAFKRRTAANPSNLHLRNVRGGGPLFPHYAMYRGTILETTTEQMLAALREGPQIHVMLAHAPLGWHPAVAAAVGLVAYRVERKVARRIRARWPLRLGYEPTMVRADTCANADELADLILQSSCVPPLMPLMRRGTRGVLDGALVDGVPVEQVAHLGPTLVLLSRHDDVIPTPPGVVAVRPSAPLPIKLWDYASPQRVQATFDQGRRDGELLARALEAGAPLPASLDVRA
ncbi:MAG: patatin-like phospholipase family protein [Nannocystaceae bacterium]|nr:patatin-like phospholipase family protein [bacterium]